MTGPSSPWPLPVRVELIDDAVIKFADARHDEVRFTQDQIDRAFQAGLSQPPSTTERDPGIPATVTLIGEARFLLGQVDLGVDLGMEVLRRGLETTIDAVARGSRKNPESHGTSDVEREPSRSERAADVEPADEPNPREILIPVHEAGDRFDDLLGEIEQGAHVVLVQHGRRMAVLMSWSDYADLRGKLAAAAAAFWTAWRAGVFDVAGYATDITTILHETGAKPVPRSDDQDDFRKGDDRDDEAD